MLTDIYTLTRKITLWPRHLVFINIMVQIPRRSTIKRNNFLSMPLHRLPFFLLFNNLTYNVLILILAILLIIKTALLTQKTNISRSSTPLLIKVRITISIGTRSRDCVFLVLFIVRRLLLLFIRDVR